MLERRQARVAAQIRAAIPQARIGRRFTILLNALTVSLPAAKLPALLATPAVAKVYPSVAYTLALDRSPSIIGADVLRRTTSADGTGIKIAVVDDGIDQSNPFFDPAGFSVPRRLSEGRDEMDDAEGDRREGVPRPERRRAGTPRRRSRFVVPRHARRGHRGGRVRHDGAGGRRPPDGRPA